MNTKTKLYLYIVLIVVIYSVTPVRAEEHSSDMQDYNEEQTIELSGVEKFVSRMYNIVLRREYDDVGFDMWVSGLECGDINGATIAEGFVLSEEFTNQDLSNEDFLNIMYEAFLNRMPDEDGFSTWYDLLENGVSRRFVCYGFVGSLEFKTLCDEYGIIPGEIQLTEPVDKNPQITMFVNRCYVNILNRKPDSIGLNNWVNHLANFVGDGASVAESFVFSEEFFNQNLSDEEFIIRMYRAFLGREPDQPGFENWYAYLKNGVSRRFVCSGFVGSQEFQKLCNCYGINIGKMTMYTPIDVNPQATMYFYDCYKIILRREPSEDELNFWVGKVNLDELSPLDVVKELFESKEFELLNLSDEDFIKVLYQIIYESECDDENLGLYINELQNSNLNRKKFFENFTAKIPQNALGISSVAYVFVGDSRFLGMDEACQIETHSERYFSISMGATGCYWFVTQAVPEIESLRKQHPEIVSWCIISGMGVNDMENINYYLSEYERLKSIGYQLYLVSVTPVEDGGTIIFNKDIDEFNKKLITMQGVTHIDCNSYLKKKGFTTLDKLHFTDESYWDIFEYIRSYLAF